MIDLILNLLYKNKAENIKALNNNNLYFNNIIIATGMSHKHVKYISKNIITFLKQRNIKNIIISGKNTDWIILDLDVVTIHIMSKDIKNLYNLEELYDQTEKN